MNATTPDPYRIDRHQVIVTAASFVASAAVVAVVLAVYGLSTYTLVAAAVVALTAGAVGWLLGGESRRPRTAAVVGRETPGLRHSA